MARPHGIGIIGVGAVGGTIYRAMRLYYEDVRGYDVLPERSHNSLDEVLACDVVFLCVPTTSGPDGRLDTDDVSRSLQRLVERKYHGLLVVKSTLPVGFFDGAAYDLDIVFSPEFLFAWRAIQDFIDPPFVIASGASAEQLRDVLYWIPRERFYVVSHDTAILTKLVMNAFAATKISFVNEVEGLCDRHGVNPITVMRFLRLEGRCAEPYSHPRRGAFGGTCLPKDLMEVLTVTMSKLLQAVWDVNERTKQTYQEY